MRFFLLSLLLAFTSAGPKAKGKDRAAETQSPTAAPAPTPEMVVLDLKQVGTTLFRLIEAEQYVNASLLFAIGMKYITNGKTYEIDLSMPAAIKSIPKRNRTQLVWTYSDLYCLVLWTDTTEFSRDDYEIWGHAMTSYATGAFDPEFINLHFNKFGLIDVFSHITPKPAQCSAMVVKDVVKLALMRPDGTIVDAPQAQLEKMMAQQEAAKAAAKNSTNTNGTISSNATVTTLYASKPTSNTTAASSLYAAKPTNSSAPPSSNSTNSSTSSNSSASLNTTK